MGYLKNRLLESVPLNEANILLQKYQRTRVPELNEEQLKMLDEIIDCQIEDNKLKRSEKNDKRK